MKLIVDTANIDKIKEYIDYLPIEGVTTNPSILSKEGKLNFSDYLNEIRSIIGEEKQLHVQVISDTTEGMIQDAEDIVSLIDRDVYIKIPVNKPGLKAIKILKNQGYKVTATAIYSTMQGLLATECGVDFLAPYINRMENLGTNPYEVVSQLSINIDSYGYKTKILGASYKNINQVIESLMSGAEYVTVGLDVIDKFLDDKNIDQSINVFSSDWEKVYKRKSII